MYPVIGPEGSTDKDTPLVMVGTGPRCENTGWQITGVCLECGHKVTLTKKTCKRIECPQCWRSWAGRAAQRTAARVWGYRQATGTHHKPRHVVASLDSLDWKAAKEKLSEIGATGGVLVVHPWRIKDEHKEWINKIAEKYEINRYEVVKSHYDPLSLLVYAPHVHGIVYGRFKDIEPNSGKFQYKNIRRLNSMHGVERLMVYLLSHTFVPKTKHTSALRYLGVCSPQKLKPEFTCWMSTEMICSKCGGFVCYENTEECILTKRFCAMGWKYFESSRKTKRRPREEASKSTSLIQPPKPRVSPMATVLLPNLTLLFDSV